MNSAVAYLNNMQVPGEKIQNVQNYPEIVKAFKRRTRFCG